MSKSNVVCPIVQKNKYQLIDINGEIISYFNENNEKKDDLTVPNLSPSDKLLVFDIIEKSENKTDREIYLTPVSSIDTNAIKNRRLVK